MLWSRTGNGLLGESLRKKTRTFPVGYVALLFCYMTGF